MVSRFVLVFVHFHFVLGNMTDIGYWTQWFDLDSPRVGSGDIETIETIENNGFAVCHKQYTPYLTECRTHIFDNWLVFNENEAMLAPDKLINPCSRTGIECRNSDQPMEAMCRDYQVRFYCALQGKDIVTEENHTMIALAAGLTFLVPIVIALIINVWHRNCRKHHDRLPVVSRSVSTENSDHQELFDPPPSYNCLFGNNPTTASTEYLVAPSNSNNEQTQNQVSHLQLTIHTLPSSNMCSVTEADVEQQNQQFRDRIKRFPGMHLSVMDMYNQYQECTTPPPSYTEALAILGSPPKKPEDNQPS